MIRKFEMYQVVCDRCGTPCEDNFYGSCGWLDKDTAEIFAGASGWELIGGKHYCPDCFEYDEETDSFIVKQDKKEE